MRQTLFFIPDQIGNLPVFGVGLLLTLWLIGGALVLIYLIRKQGLNADTKSYLPVFVIVGLVHIVDLLVRNGVVVQVSSRGGPGPLDRNPLGLNTVIRLYSR